MSRQRGSWRGEKNAAALPAVPKSPRPRNSMHCGGDRAIRWPAPSAKGHVLIDGTPSTGLPSCAERAPTIRIVIHISTPARSMQQAPYYHPGPTFGSLRPRPAAPDAAISPSPDPGAIRPGGTPRPSPTGPEWGDDGFSAEEIDGLEATAPAHLPRRSGGSDDGRAPIPPTAILRGPTLSFGTPRHRDRRPHLRGSTLRSVREARRTGADGLFPDSFNRGRGSPISTAEYQNP